MAGRHPRLFPVHRGNDTGTRAGLGQVAYPRPGGGLFEVRAKGREGIGRAFYCTAVEQRIVLLHAFTKKTEQTPKRELDAARARLKEIKA